MALIRGLVLLGALVLLQTPVSNQTPVRDAAVPVVRGSAVIAGRLVSGSDSQTPIRRARVTLRAVDSSWLDTTVSDDDGRFRFDRLASGRYRLTATKPAFLRASYGETQPNRAGVALALADGQQLTNIVMPMWKGAVIAGTIRDASGEPAAQVEVHVVGRAVGRTVWTREESSYTDDHGRYRIFGLLPGEYVVASTPRSMMQGGLTETTSASVRWAESMLRSPSSAVPAPPNPGTVGYANVFYPGTTHEADAAILTLAPGDERIGIDLQIQRVTVGSVQGTVVDPSGRPVEHAELFMTPTTGVILAFSSLFEAFSNPFTFRGVPPGEYLIIARTTGPPRAGLFGAVDAVQVGVAGVGVVSSQQSPSDAMWATTTVSTSGRDVTGVVLTLQPTISVTGRVVFDVSSQTPPDLSDLRLGLTAVPGSQRLSIGSGTATIQPDGTFAINSLLPGRYLWRVSDSTPDFRSRWMMQSALARGTDVAHRQLDLTSGRAPESVVVTFTDRLTELAGTLQDSAGRPAADFHIVVFPTDRGDWYRGSPKLQTTRPATNGSFTLRGLPPGEYFVAAMTDVESDEWQDTALLTQLAAAAARVRITAGQRTMQDLRVGR